MNASDTAGRIDRFLARYTPEIEAQLRDARARLRAHFPRGFELVFDNYNALVFGFSPSERSRESFISIAGYPKWVTLFFLRGADLDDPQGLLEGEGKQVRGVHLKRPDDIDSPAVTALIRQAIATHESALQASPPLSTVIKAEVEKRRPWRPSSPEPKSDRRSAT